MSKHMNKTERLLTRPHAARALGISIPTLRKYEAEGVLHPTTITPTGRGLYSPEALLDVDLRDRLGRTLVYAGAGKDASSAQEVLVHLCKSRGWPHEVVGAGGRGEFAGVARLLEELLRGAARLVLPAHSALPAGFRIGVLDLCEAQGIEVVIMAQPVAAKVKRGPKR